MYTTCAGNNIVSRNVSRKQYGRLTHQFLPIISEWLNKPFIQPDFHLTQILSGHGNFCSYLHRFKLQNSDICDCDNSSSQTVTHLIFYCNKFDNFRDKLIQHSFSNNQNWPCSLTFFTENSENFRLLQEFITKTGATNNEWTNGTITES